jgi:D-sedoheptulose 7-phosphate isomerase
LDYSKIFAAQIELEAKEGDLLVVFTASGNSPNVISAISQASSQGLMTVAFTGFDGGMVKERVDIAIHVETPKGEYGLVEDIHLSLTHYLAERFRLAFAR